MSKIDSAAGLSRKASKLFIRLAATGSSEDYTVADFLNTVASNGQGQQKDEFLAGCAEQMAACAAYVARTLRRTAQVSVTQVLRMEQQRIPVTCTWSKTHVEIAMAGYGVAKCEDAAPILLDLRSGRLQLFVWSDITQEDPTAIIDLENACESRRVREVHPLS
jgi:hypothetical protein